MKFTTGDCSRYHVTSEKSGVKAGSQYYSLTIVVTHSITHIIVICYQALVKC